MDTLTLFGEPPAPKPERPAIEGPVWSRVKTSTKCAHCVRALIETHGEAPASRTARFRRRTKDTDVLLCHEHAQRLRQADGMPALRAPRA